MTLKIYVASSWRNEIQPEVVQCLKESDYDVYDFKHPKPENDGFSWREIDNNYLSWDLDQYLTALEHPTAQKAYNYDMHALINCDVCLLVLPCNRSAHLKLGYAVGQKKKTIILLNRTGYCEPELMYKMCDLVTYSMVSVLSYLNDIIK